MPTWQVIGEKGMIQGRKKTEVYVVSSIDTKIGEPSTRSSIIKVGEDVTVHENSVGLEYRLEDWEGF